MSEEEKSKSSAGCWAISIVVALVLYVLSPPPVSAFFDKHPPSPTLEIYLRSFFQVFYYPFRFIDNSPIGKLYEQYYQWCKKVIP